MDDLVAFLRARFLADEVRAKGLGAIVVNVQGHVIPNFTGYSARRVLVEVDAKRRIIAEYEATELYEPREALAAALRALASVYADHPDYDPAWTGT